MKHGVAVCAGVALLVASGARGEFLIGGADFGGGSVGLLGHPLVPVGGVFVPQSTNDTNAHVLLNATFGGASGWGTGVIGLQDDAPSAVPGDPSLGTFVADIPLDVVAFPGVGPGDPQLMFGGFAGGANNPPGPAIISDDDAWVARIRLTSGATISTSGGVNVAVKGPDDVIESNLYIDETGVIGTSGGLGDNRVGTFDYRLEYRLIPNLFTDGSDVYDVFVVQFPTPGTVAMFGMMGLMGTMRRNRNV